MPKTQLSIVPPTPPEPSLDDFEPIFLSTPLALELYWPQTAAILSRCIDEAMNGEMTLDDIYEGVRDGHMYALVAKNDEGELPQVAFAMILELTAYPQFALMNITAIGGRGMGLFKSRFWKHFCSWVYMSGVRTTQVFVSPAMTRMLRPYGFTKVYDVLRLDLTEM